MVITSFGGRAAVCLRGARGRLYRVRSRLCGAWSRKRRSALCGGWSCIRSTGIRWAWIRWAGIRWTGIWWTGIRATRARLQSFCVPRSPWTGIRPTASLYRAGAGLLVRLCGRECTEAARRYTLQPWWSLHRQSRLWPVGTLQLRHHSTTEERTAHLSRPMPIKASIHLLNVPETWLPQVAQAIVKNGRRTH
jgi:hypothetical protein